MSLIAARFHFGFSTRRSSNSLGVAELEVMLSGSIVPQSGAIDSLSYAMLWSMVDDLDLIVLPRSESFSDTDDEIIPAAHARTKCARRELSSIGGSSKKNDAHKLRANPKVR
jgi:hypothetical protein